MKIRVGLFQKSVNALYSVFPAFVVEHHNSNIRSVHGLILSFVSPSHEALWQILSGTVTLMFKMNKKTKKTLVATVWEFIRLQISGNVLFWATYLGYAVADNVFHATLWVAIAVPSLLAHFLFFIIDKNWVFSDKTGTRKTRAEIIRFVLFMGLNYFLNIGIVTGLQNYFGITPYFGQFISAFFFTFWTWAGLKFWVFRAARHARHHALTIETRNTNAKRHAKYQRLAAKQKAKRTATVSR